MRGNAIYLGGPRDGQLYSGDLHPILEFVIEPEPQPVTWPPDLTIREIEFKVGRYRLIDTWDGRVQNFAYQYLPPSPDAPDN